SPVLSAASHVLVTAGETDIAGAAARSIVDPTQQASAVYEITEAMARRGEIEPATALAKSFSDIGVLASGLCGGAVVLSHAGKVEEAQAIADEVVDARARAAVLERLIEVLRSQRRDDVASELLDRAVLAAETISDRGPAIDAVCAIGDTLLDLGTR